MSTTEVEWNFDQFTLCFPLQLISTAISEVAHDVFDPSDVLGTYSTGNCAFGTHAALGVCAWVKDVGSTILQRLCEDSKGR